MLPTTLATLTKKMLILAIFSEFAHLSKSKKKLHHFDKIPQNIGPTHMLPC